MSPRASILKLLLPLVLLALPCAAADDVTQLWENPGDLESRDLFYGPGGRELVPDPDAVYRFKKLDTKGHSDGYEVDDPRDREWKIKVGDEVGSEIAVSRILWAIGYHQPVLHYVPRWRMTGGPSAAPQPGRFRLESDHKKEGEWSWKDNPFVHSQPFRGLVVVNILLNNWDLEPGNNRVYQMKGDVKGPARRYVVQDLGGSLAKTRRPIGGRNDIDGFESQAFVKGVTGDQVEFDYHGPHGKLVKTLTPADVIWGCRLLARLSDRQLIDAFRAAGYPEDVQQRYVRKIRQKIGEGLALDADAAEKKSSDVLLAKDPPPTPELHEQPEQQHELRDLDQAAENLLHELRAAAMRLPLAALLGTVLALRPRRRGSPSRKPVVVQTQIVIAVVGALIMLVVGASLARAFGIVGVASLVRYRSKIDDPKDAVVMLAALGVGLASGVGLYALSVFSTLFLVATLAVIEHFEPRTRVFGLTVKLGERTAELRPRIEAVLRRHNIEHELRSASEVDVAYSVVAPHDIGTDLVTKELIALDPDGKGAVEWVENPKAKPTIGA